MEHDAIVTTLIAIDDFEANNFKRINLILIKTKRVNYRLYTLSIYILKPYDRDSMFNQRYKRKQMKRFRSRSRSRTWSRSRSRGRSDSRDSEWVRAKRLVLIFPIYSKLIDYILLLL